MGNFRLELRKLCFFQNQKLRKNGINFFLCSADIPETIDGMPLTDVKLINIKLISLAELKLITQLGGEGRKKLAELFTGPNRLASSLNRDSTI